MSPDTDIWRSIAQRLLIDGSMDSRWHGHRAIVSLCSLVETSFFDKRNPVSLSQRQDDVWRFICRHMDLTKVWPSRREIAAGADITSLAEVNRYLVALEEKGYFQKLPQKRVAYRILIRPEDVA